jgi:hypothetical protein
MILALKMACTSTRFALTENFRQCIAGTQASSHGRVLLPEGQKSIGDLVDEVVSDSQNFEDGEERPSNDAITSIKSILADAATNYGKSLPTPAVATYYGEVDATWQKDNRMLRLIAYSDGRPPTLYFCTDQGEVLTRGETLPATGERLSEKLDWLMG